MKLPPLKSRMLTAGLGVLTFAAMAVWSVPGLDPSLSDEMSEVAGLRPPQMVIPGFWRACVWPLVRLFGLQTALRLLPPLGWLLAALSVMLCHRFLLRLVPLMALMTRPHDVWERKIVPLFAAVATLVFAAGDPVWHVSQTLAPDGIQLFLLLAIAYLSIRWFDRSSRRCVCGAFALMGLLASETAFGFVLPFVFCYLHHVVWSRLSREDAEEKTDDLVFSVLPCWKLFFLFLAGFAVGAEVNLAVFQALGGPKANGWLVGTSWLRYGIRFCRNLMESATWLGGLLALLFGLIPLVLSFSLVPCALRDDRRMPFGIGILLFAVLVITTMNSGLFPSACFWTFDFGGGADLVKNGFLLSSLMLCSATALALCGSAFAFECQQVYLSDELQQALDEAGEDELDREDLTKRLREQGLLRPATAAVKVTVPLLGVLLVVELYASLSRPEAVEMQRIVQDAISEIVDECGDAEWLFTDGRLDAEIELESARRGRRLRTLNMLGGGSPWSVAVRLRGFDVKTADGKAAATGVPILFRTWADEKPNGLDSSALMIGFEFWKRANTPLPTISGLVGRTKGLTDDEAADGVRRMRKLSDRILAHSRRVAVSRASRALRDAHTAVVWRLSRIARFRNDSGLADELIDSNEKVKRIVGAIEEERRRVLMQMTPMEALQVALSRTDFAEARRHATDVLNYDEDNVSANFAMGMSSIAMNRMRDAEMYLLKCHRLRPGEVSVANNLSIVYRKLGQYDEALKFAKLAVSLLPDSPETKQTLEDAEKKRP